MAKLTEKQEKFAQGVGTSGLSQADAYRGAYSFQNMSEEAIWQEASRVAKSPHVSARIAELKAKRVDKMTDVLTFDVKKLMETYIAIAFVDPNELISQRAGACRHCWGLGGAYHWKEREYLEALAEWERYPVHPKTGKSLPMPDPSGGLDYRFTADPNPDCLECEGAGLLRFVNQDTTKLSPGAKMLYQGLQPTKGGMRILFASKDKALDQIGRILGAYDDKLRLNLQGAVATLQLTTNDPKQAAEDYARMLKGG